MTATTQHTPTPWHAGHLGTPDAYIASDNGHNVIETGRVHSDDAAFIVTACNAHDELVAALRSMVELFGPTKAPAIVAARAALAKVTP